MSLPAYEHLLVEEVDGVAILTLNRPAKLNALNRRLNAELHDAIKALEENVSVGCIVVTGAGDRAFSAGGDIHEQRSGRRRRHPRKPTPSRGSGPRPLRDRRLPQADDRDDQRPRLRGRGGAGLVPRHARRLRARPVPVPRCGLRADQRHLVLPNQIGWPIAKELLFSGREVLAEEALRIGLLNHLVACADLRAKTLELATMIAANDRTSVMGVKALLLGNLGASLEAQWAAEADYSRIVARPTAAGDAFSGFTAGKGKPA